MSDERKPDAADEGGPVPVRDLMRPAAARPEAEGEPRWEGDEHTFELDGVEWAVRPAGVGMYGTGGHGTARLLAIHFFRADAPERPVREALIPAGSFDGLRAEELARMYEGATPIEIEDDSRRGTDE